MQDNCISKQPVNFNQLKKHDGLELSILAQVARFSRNSYTPRCKTPSANIPKILYECKESQIDRSLKPVIEGEKTTCFGKSNRMRVRTMAA